MPRTKPINNDGTRDCSSCQKPYPNTEEYFPRSSQTKSGLYPYCKLCHSAKVRRRARKNRWDALSRYSSGVLACACCGDATLEFLVLDHIDGGGNKHRAELREKSYVGEGFYRWLRMQGYPDGYRVLCQNCNSSHGHYGYCPHTQHTPRLSPADLAAIVARVAAAERAAG